MIGGRAYICLCDPPEGTAISCIVQSIPFLMMAQLMVKLLDHFLSNSKKPPPTSRAWGNRSQPWWRTGAVNLKSASSGLRIFNGNFRNRLIGGICYLFGLCKAYVREYPIEIWPYTVHYLQFRILKLPLKYCNVEVAASHDWFSLVGKSRNGRTRWHWHIAILRFCRRGWARRPKGEMAHKPLCDLISHIT